MLFPFLVDFHLRILGLVLANVKELYKNYLRLKPRFDTNLEPHIKHSYKKNQCTHDKTGECTLRWPFHLIKTSFDKKCRVNTNSGNLVELLQYRVSGGDKTIENHLQNAPWIPHKLLGFMNYGWCNMCYIFRFNDYCSRNLDIQKWYSWVVKGLII